MQPFSGNSGRSMDSSWCDDNPQCFDHSLYAHRSKPENNWKVTAKYGPVTFLGFGNLEI